MTLTIEPQTRHCQDEPTRRICRSKII